MIFDEISAMLLSIMNDGQAAMQADAPFAAQKRMEPIHYAKLIMAAEKKWRIQIHDEDAASFLTLRELCDHIQALLDDGMVRRGDVTDEERLDWFYESNADVKQNRR